MINLLRKKLGILSSFPQIHLIVVPVDPKIVTFSGEMSLTFFIFIRDLHQSIKQNTCNCPLAYLLGSRFFTEPNAFLPLAAVVTPALLNFSFIVSFATSAASGETPLSFSTFFPPSLTNFFENFEIRSLTSVTP